MNRRITNVIRFMMDELVPPLIRDSKVFMYPFYYFAYRGKNIREAMSFKSNVYSFTPEEYTNFYKSIDTISRNRKTDLNQGCIDAILDLFDDSEESIIDVGCGNGYILKEIAEQNKNKSLHGFDLKKPKGELPFIFTSGNIESLPFEDNSFDTVLCNHTIEHLLGEEKCVRELIRITKNRLVIVTPCQRYFYYTLDEHVNFYPFEEKLTSVIPLEHYKCTKIQGDWFYLGEKKKINKN